MFTRSCRRQRRSRHPILISLAFMLLLLAPALDSAAQGIRIQAQPTPTPTEEFQPNLQARPTPTPTPRVTEEPAPPDDVVANPTAAPTEEPQPAAPSSLTLNKGACDDSAFDAYSATGLQSFLDACQGPDGEFEFTVSNGGGFDTTQSTELGSLFMQVPTGAISITETIPAGWGDPAVFCWSNFFPTPSDTPFIGNSPQWDVAEGEDIECWWFNVSDSGSGHDFYLDKYECPEGFDPTGDWQAFSLGCTTAMDAGFNVTDGQGPMFQETTGGHAVWPDIDFGDGGDLVITETVPEGYGEPVVFCTILPAGAADPEDFETQQMTVADGEVTAAPVLGEQDQYHCAFFNIPEDGAPDDLTTTDPQEGGQGATVTVVKHRCPLGVPEDATLDQYIVICTALFDGIPFTLEHAGGSFPGETGDDGQVEWPNVPAGDVEIHEDIPPGYKDPLTFCISFDGEQELQSGQVDAAGGIVPLTIPDEATAVVCYMFNIPDAGDQESRVLVNKRICPDDVDFVLSDENVINDIIVACPETGDGIEFTLDNANGSSTQAIDGDGATYWDDVPQGPFTLTEDIPAGYGEPVWFCAFNYYEDGEVVHVPPVAVDAPDGVHSASFDDPEGGVYYCWVFNVPDDGSSVTVNKWLCPVGFDVEVDDPEAECTEPMDNVNFTLNDLVAKTGDDGPGVAVFEDVPPGDDYELTEFLPGDIASAFVTFCSLSGEPDLIPLSDEMPPVVFLDVAEGDHWECHWYNVPGDPGEENVVEILKWRCPEGTSQEESLDWYTDNCTEEHDGVDFKVASDIGIAVMETVGGQVQFEGLPDGTAGIQETIPDGFGPPVVFCAPDDSLWQLYDAPTGHWEYDFIDDGISETLVCYVYNIPAGDGDVTILKWTCPEGYDLFAEGADPALDCTEATNGIDFQFGLSGLEEEAELQTTGELIDGGVFFDDLDPDIYKAVELVPEGIETVFVLECTGHIMGVLQPYPLQMGNVLEIEVGAGEHLVCHWFNVPGVDPELGQITVYKYVCSTGTFVSDVDCEIYEDGQAFDLLHWNVEDGVWEVVDTGVTDGFGNLGWLDLPPGDYGLDEVGGDWCHLDHDAGLRPRRLLLRQRQRGNGCQRLQLHGRTRQTGGHPDRIPEHRRSGWAERAVAFCHFERTPGESRGGRNSSIRRISTRAPADAMGQAGCGDGRTTESTRWELARHRSWSIQARYAAARTK